MLIIAEIKTDDGKLLGVMPLPPKEFKKIEIDGRRYQAQIKMVEIGSKKTEGGE